MSDHHPEPTQSRFTLSWDHPASQLILLVLMIAVGLLARLGLEQFAWFQEFEEQHGFWMLVLFGWATIPLLYVFRRKRRLTDQLRFRDDLRRGRVMRMSLASRCVVMLVSLGLVVTGSLVSGKDGGTFLLFGVPVLLLMAIEELNIILRPGDVVTIGNRHDELLAYFKARTLQVGYSIAIFSMAALCLISLFASKYTSVLLPIALCVSLLAPSLFYSRLDRQSGADG